MSQRLFGTDGVRGTAGEHPLDHETVARLGAALVRVMRTEDRPLRFIAGRDTRESGEWIERELARGVRAESAHITSAGVLPTPAVAYVTREMGYDAGLVISASHNPFQDNGIKVFSGRGEKFTETLERQVEAIVADRSWSVGGSADVPVERTDVIDAYIAHARLALPDPLRLGRLKIAIDTANGATTTVAPRLFEELGFDVQVLSASPDGRNINLDCGSTHPQNLARAVVERGCRLGVAFDGDGDRAILVDANGHVVDGDAVLLMCARHLKSQGQLSGNGIVATVMSNIGLEIGLRDSGIEIVRCPVGDKYVMEEMIRRGLSLGGEQSGHIIFSDHLFTGDGIVTALSVLRVMADTGRELADLAAELVTYPQVLLNVRVREKKDLEAVPAVADSMRRVEARLAGNGRLLVRYSGTEPLLRVMIEGKDQQEIQGWAAEIVSTVKEHLGMTGGRSQAKLSVNVNKVATLRNSRGGSVPSVVEASRVSIAAGSPGITVHPRADARHIRFDDVREIAGELARQSHHVELNIEGDPRPDLLALAEEVKPDQFTLVPVRAGEITSQAGWDPATPLDGMRGIVSRLQAVGIRVSVFVDPDEAAVRWAAAVGGDRVELYTEPFAKAFHSGAGDASFVRYARMASLAHELGLGVNAGHDLDLDNLTLFHQLPHLDEASIGHALIGHALYVGLDRAVRDYIAALRG